MGLRRIFGPKRAKMTGKWRKPYNVELNDLYCSPGNPDKKMGGTCRMYGGRESCILGFGGET